MLIPVQAPQALEAPVKYTYKKLGEGEIRLLELLPDSTHLTGRLRHWQIDGDPDSPQYERLPQYTALSHHWDPKPKASEEPRLPVLILLDPDDPQKKNLYELRLRPSLYDGLLAIREKMNTVNWRARGWTRYIWVDAICIDQTSLSDKDMQLGRMGNIYNDAQAVVVWLGKLDKEIKLAMEFVQELQELNLLNTFITDEQYSDRWKSLVMLVRKPWFRRLWIVQEIAAARDAVLLSGDQSVSWDDFASAWSIFVSQFEQVRTMLAKAGFFAKERDPFGDVKLSAADILVNNSKTLLRKRQGGDIAEHLRPLEYLLTSLSMFEVTEPHDAVYAILWLSSDASQGKKSHVWNMRTPLPEEVRPDKRPRREPVNPNSTLLSPAPASESITHRRKLSFSSQFSEIPAALLEQKQAEEQKTGDSGIKINYKQPVFELCCQVLKHIIKTTKRLDILCFQWAPPPAEKGSDGDSETEVEQEEYHPTWLPCVQRNAYNDSLTSSSIVLDGRDHRVQQNPTSQRVNADPLIGTPGSNRRPYLACGRTRAEDFEINGRVLHVGGLLLAKIDVDAGAAPDAVIPWKWREVLNWTNNAELPSDQFWRTLVADKGPDDQPPPPRFQLACKWAFQLAGDTPAPPKGRGHRVRLMGPNMNLEKIRNRGDGEAPLKEFLDRAIATTWNRKLFKTQGCGGSAASSEDASFAGLGPDDLQVGDVVCVLLGCAVPVILRPKPGNYSSPGIPTIITDQPSLQEEPACVSLPNGTEGKKRARVLPKIIVNETIIEHYEFVGECYVHGMMNGEIFHWADKHGKKVQDFYLH